MKRFFVFVFAVLLVALVAPAAAETWGNLGAGTASEGFGYTGGGPIYTLGLDCQTERGLLLLDGKYFEADKAYGLSVDGYNLRGAYYRRFGESRMFLGGGLTYGAAFGTRGVNYGKGSTRAEVGVVIDTDVRYILGAFGPVDDPNEMWGGRAQVDLPLFPRAQANSLSFATNHFRGSGVPASESKHLLRLEGLVGDFKASDACQADCERATDGQVRLLYVYRVPFGTR